jgi:hypothetical protein
MGPSSKGPMASTFSVAVSRLIQSSTPGASTTMQGHSVRGDLGRVTILVRTLACSTNRQTSCHQIKWRPQGRNE